MYFPDRGCVRPVRHLCGYATVPLLWQLVFWNSKWAYPPLSANKQAYFNRCSAVWQWYIEGSGSFWQRSAIRALAIGL